MPAATESQVSDKRAFDVKTIRIFYHPGEGQWRQLWTDAGNSIIDIRGGLDGDSMLLEGKIYYLQNGAERAFRGRWIPLEDGRVQQVFHEEDDKGEWQLWFEGYYTRKD